MTDPEKHDPLATDHARILDALGHPVLVIAPSFRVVYMNAAARAQYGAPELAYEAAFCHQILHGLTRPCNETGTACPVCAVFETGKPAREIHNHLAPGGAFAPEEIVASPLLDTEGRVAYVIESVHSAAEILESKEVVEHMRSELDLLRGVLPTCAVCKRIRVADDTWEEIESYVEKRSTAEFTHGLCPRCVDKLYPGYHKKKE